MPKLRLQCASRSPRQPSTRLVAPLASLALAMFVAGVACLWAPHSPLGPEPFRPAAGVVLIVAGIAIARIAAAAWSAALPTPWARWIFWQALVAGGGACYAVSLLLGPQHGAQWFFGSMTALWATALVTLMTAGPEALAAFPRALRGRLVRRTAFGASVAVATALSAEGVLRIVEVLSPDRHALITTTVEQSLAVSAVVGQSRVALLGAAAVAENQPGWAAAVEKLSPGVESRLIGTSSSRLVDYADELTAGANQWQPGLVVAFVPAVDTSVPSETEEDLFDWRSLRLAQLASGWWSCAAATSAPNSCDDGRGRAIAFAACRIPSDDTTKQNWRRQMQRLDELVASCQAQGAQLAIVVVPADFQVNLALCQTLQRRSGCKPSELDVDLPQRRLAAYAADRKLPLVDLLPILQNCAQPAFDRQSGRLSVHGSQLAEQALCGWLGSRLSATLPMTAQVSPTPSP